MTKRTPNFDSILAPSRSRKDDGGYRDTADVAELTADEAGAIAAIAYQMGSADGTLANDEREYWDALVTWLSARTDPKALRALAVKLEKGGDATIEENVRAFAGMLRRPFARDVAYKAAYGLRIWDLEANDDEDELDEILVEALELGGRAADLADEVNEALMAGG